MMKRIGMQGVALAALVLGASGVASGQEIDRDWELVREDLEIWLDPELGSLRLEGTLVARLVGADTSDGPTLGVNTRDRLVRFDEVLVAGAAVELNVPFEKKEDVLFALVRFDEPKRRGDEVAVSFACHAEASGNQLVVNEDIAFASWVEGWYPIVARPEGVSFSAATKVPGSTTFYLPDGWHAVTNGALVAEEPGREVWESELPLSRSFAAGPYEVLRETVDGFAVSLYMLSDDVHDPRDHVESLAIAIDAMEERWGPYPYPSYAIAEVPEEHGHFGASSEQGFILVKPYFLRTTEGNLPLFAHEASHGWWGNTIGADGDGSLMCTEALAQYGAVIAAERLWGEAGATEFLRFSRPGYITSQCARGFFEMQRHGGDKPLSQLVPGNTHDHTLSDAKGHWVYHMLRRRVGDERFFATMRKLIADFTGRAMTLDDIRAAFVAAAPDADLEVFFEQWLDRAGAPVLRHEWQPPTSLGDPTVELTIEQLQAGEPYDLKLDVALTAPDGTRRLEEVRLRERRATFRLDAPGGVAAVELDPDHRLLLWDPAYGEPPVDGADRTLPPLSPDEIGVYTGTFHIDELASDVVVGEDAGQLIVTLGTDPPKPLVRTLDHRFRADDGFVVFDVVEGRAASFTFLHDGGGHRRAVRSE